MYIETLDPRLQNALQTHAGRATSVQIYSFVAIYNNVGNMPRIIPYRITIKYIIIVSLSRGSRITMYNTYNIIQCGVIRSDVYYLFRPFAEICGFGGKINFIFAHQETLF